VKNAKTKPLRHPDAKRWLRDKSDESHFGHATHAAFEHAAYTFRHFFTPMDYRWMALACCERAGVPRDVIRDVAKRLGVDLQEAP
jgi:hypothetical protein